MNNIEEKLEDFIKSHKNAFDDYKPSDALWQRIERNLDKGEKKTGRTISMKRWLQVAAAIIGVIITISVVSYLIYAPAKVEDDLSIVKNDDTLDMKGMVLDSTNLLADAFVEGDTLYNSSLNKENDREKKSEATLPIEEEELFHYTRLIEIKQGQMAQLKKNEPELYEAFSADMNRLEADYQSLKQQFKEGLNREMLLEAMIQNLKMQSDLLNKQLEILKEVHHKKKKNESYKSL